MLKILEILRRLFAPPPPSTLRQRVIAVHLINTTPHRTWWT